MTPPVRDDRRDERGFTLIELMVATVLLTLVTGMTMQLAFTMVEGFRTQRSALAIERNARGAIDLLATAARAASTGVVTGDLRDTSGCTDVLGVDTVNAADGPDRLRVIYGLPGTLTSITGTVTASTSQFDVIDATGIAGGDQLIITTGEVGRVFPVDAIVGSRISTSNGACSGMTIPDFPAGSLVLRARVAELYVANAIDGTPLLMLDPDGAGDREPEPIAEGIEDLQIAIGVDADGDGVLVDADDATDEWHYNAEDDLPPPAITGGKWRAIRITVVARDLATGVATSTRPRAEDHPAGTLDDHRRRVLSTTVEIRNFVQESQ
jgi:prepilin-type N-terminal cleavage/methylation domain-containing protein